MLGTVLNMKMDDNFDWKTRFEHQLKWNSQFRDFLYKRYNIGSYHRVIDVGCGTGSLLIELCSIVNGELYGSDFDSKMLQKAKSSLKPLQKAKCYRCSKLKLIEDDICDSNLPSEFFDICFTNLIFLWIENIEDAFHHLHRILKKDGLLFILAEPDYGGMIEYPETGVKSSLIDNLTKLGADPLIGRKLSKYFKDQFIIEETNSTSIPWLGAANKLNLLKEVDFFIKILGENSFDSMKMRASILNGDYFLFNPSFSYVLRKIDSI